MLNKKVVERRFEEEGKPQGVRDAYIAIDAFQDNSSSSDRGVKVREKR